MLPPCTCLPVSDTVTTFSPPASLLRCYLKAAPAPLGQELGAGPFPGKSQRFCPDVSLEAFGSGSRPPQGCRDNR